MLRLPNADWSEALADKDSNEYKQMMQSVKQEILSQIQGGGRTFENISFRFEKLVELWSLPYTKNAQVYFACSRGSVIVEAEFVETDDTLSRDIIEAELKDAVSAVSQERIRAGHQPASDPLAVETETVAVEEGLSGDFCCFG